MNVFRAAITGSTGITLAVLLAGASPQAPEYIRGIKFPNPTDRDREPVTTFAKPADLSRFHQSSLWESPNSSSLPTRFGDLIPDLLPAPDQEDAGSCLYMAVTGIAEFWLNRATRAENPSFTPTSEGPTDLSERYMMGLSGIDENDSGVENWRTDVVYLLNRNEHHNNAGILNSTYRFTKGWYRDSEDEYKPARESDEGVSYGASFNWIDLWAPQNNQHYVNLPTFAREVLFADPNRNQWATGVAPEGIVEQIKAALVENQAPVLVIYNHYRYWHAVMVVGYDDETETECRFTELFISYMHDKASETRQKATEARSAGNEEEAIQLERSAAKTEEAAIGAQTGYDTAGGCSGRGVFLVRDSIYGEDTQPVYDYDLTRTGDEGHYSRLLVEHEYEWVQHMANHFVQILPVN